MHLVYESVDNYEPVLGCSSYYILCHTKMVIRTIAVPTTSGSYYILCHTKMVIRTIAVPTASGSYGLWHRNFVQWYKTVAIVPVANNV